MASTSKSTLYPTYSGYHVLLGLSLMTTATICFYSFSISLATSRSTALEALLFPASQVYPEALSSISISPHQTSNGLPLTLVELTNLMTRLEAQIHELKAVTAQHASIVSKYRHRNTASEDELKIALNVLTVLLCVVVKVVGLTILGTALKRISEIQWYRTASFGVVGANLGVMMAVWGLSASPWDRIVAFAMAGLDIGIVVGGLSMGSMP